MISYLMIISLWKLVFNFSERKFLYAIHFNEKVTGINWNMKYFLSLVKISRWITIRELKEDKNQILCRAWLSQQHMPWGHIFRGPFCTLSWKYKFQFVESIDRTKCIFLLHVNYVYQFFFSLSNNNELQYKFWNSEENEYNT